MSMSFHALHHKMWSDKNGTFRKILEQHGRDAAFFTLYLMSSPHAEQSGLYYCPTAYMVRDTGMLLSTVEKHLVNLERSGFCKYDDDADVVWVIKMPLYQVSNFPHGRDHRVKSALKKLDALPATYLLDNFVEYWQIDLAAMGVRVRGWEGRNKTRQNIRESLASPSEALAKPLHNDDVEDRFDQIKRGAS